jgi:hypothetical protein
MSTKVKSKWTEETIMASYVNVGVRYMKTPFDKAPNSEIPTKAMLKRAIAENAANVYMYGTSGFTPFGDTADNLEIGVKYSVTGPNPYTSRKWYATLEKLANGTIRVS